MREARGTRRRGPGEAARRWWTRRRLAAVFERPAAAEGRTLPIRRTGRGIWVATPIRVIEAAAGRLAAAGLLGDGAGTGRAAGSPGAARHVVDAGSGDGRVSAVLAWLAPGQPVFGVEADAALHARAEAHLRALGAAGIVDPAHVRLASADYCDPATYAAHGVALAGARLVLNYPDGNQHRLARFVAGHCPPEATLALLTHDRDLTVDALPLRSRHDVRAGSGPPWRLSLYRRSG